MDGERPKGKMTKTRIWGEDEYVRLKLRVKEICTSIYSRISAFLFIYICIIFVFDTFPFCLFPWYCAYIDLFIIHIDKTRNNSIHGVIHSKWIKYVYNEEKKHPSLSISSKKNIIYLEEFLKWIYLFDFAVSLEIENE